MQIHFTANESLEIEVLQREIPIQHYLRQPQRLVNAIAEANLTQQLSADRYAIAMRPLNFMELYHFQPTVVLKVTSDTNGTVCLNSQSCKIKGIDYINDRFSLNLLGKLSPVEKQGKTYLQGRAYLEVKVELPPPLWLTPKPLLEMAGNSLLKSVLMRIKQKLLTQLLRDYQQWTLDKTEEQKAPNRAVLGEI